MKTYFDDLKPGDCYTLPNNSMKFIRLKGQAFRGLNSKIWGTRDDNTEVITYPEENNPDLAEQSLIFNGAVR